MLQGCCRMDLSTATDTSSTPSPAWSYPCATIPSEVCLLRHRHNHSHRCFEIYLLWYGLTHSHRHFVVCCCCIGSSTGHSPFALSSHWSSILSSTAAQKHHIHWSLQVKRGQWKMSQGSSMLQSFWDLILLGCHIRSFHWQCMLRLGLLICVCLF